MRIAYEFKKQAEDSDQHLRSFIQDVNNKFKQVTKRESKGQDEIYDEIRLYETQDETNAPESTSTQSLIKAKRKPAQQRKTALVLRSANKTIPTQANLVEILESNSQENEQDVTNMDELIDDVQQLDEDTTETEVVIVDENGIEIIDNYKIDEQSSDMIEYQNQDEYGTNEFPVQIDDDDDDETEIAENVEEVFFEEEEHLYEDEDVSKLDDAFCFYH